MSGSRQLRTFRAAIRDGAPVEQAALDAGMSLIEANLTLEADAADPPPPEAYEPIGAPRKDDGMARTAKPKDDEVKEIKTPDFAKAIRIISKDIDPADEKNAKARGDLSASWKAIEDDCYCNKAAAKTFRRIRNMSDEVRDDYLRTLYGLMKADNLGISSDLVDQMEDGDAPDMPVSKRTKRALVTVN